MIISKDKYILKNCVAHIVGCSVMGSGKIENQDSIEIRQTNDSLIVVVADGLGSAAYSKEDTAFREYLIKLRYLPRRMRTAAGRKLAVERAAFMADFFEKLDLETNIGKFSDENNVHF